MGLMQDFKNFAMRGNVVDMAVGVVIGGAFGKIVSSLVNNIITPLIGLISGGTDFSNHFVALDGNEYETLEAAKGVAVLGYGAFIQSIIDFLIIAMAIFLAVRLMSAFQKKAEAAPKEPSAEVKLLQEIRDSLAKT